MRPPFHALSRLKLPLNASPVHDGDIHLKLLHFYGGLLNTVELPSASFFLTCPKRLSGVQFPGSLLPEKLVSPSLQPLTVSPR